MENMELYNKFRTVPEEAKKPIKGGRLSGYTDINPMWRIKVLTEEFGAVGIGWYYEVKRLWMEKGGKDEMAAFAEIHLFFKHEGEWSKPITGIGGNMFIAAERNGLYTNDECYKMAITDALSAACKVLGVGADVYWDKDRSKYDALPEQGTKRLSENTKESQLSEKQIKRYYAIAKGAGFENEDADKLVQFRFSKENVSKLTKLEYDSVCSGLETNKEATIQWYQKTLNNRKSA